MAQSIGPSVRLIADIQIEWYCQIVLSEDISLKNVNSTQGTKWNRPLPIVVKASVQVPDCFYHDKIKRTKNSRIKLAGNFEAIHRHTRWNHVQLYIRNMSAVIIHSTKLRYCGTSCPSSGSICVGLCQPVHLDKQRVGRVGHRNQSLVKTTPTYNLFVDLSLSPLQKARLCSTLSLLV